MKTIVRTVGRLPEGIYGQLLVLNLGTEGEMRAELEFARVWWPKRLCAMVLQDGRVLAWSLYVQYSDYEGDCEELWFYTDPEERGKGYAKRCARALLKLYPDAVGVEKGRRLVQTVKGREQVRGYWDELSAQPQPGI